jgi:thiol-disulfide isomerase/thioredoxin
MPLASGSLPTSSDQLPVTFRYYSFVKRTLSSLALICLLTLSACNGGRPPRIGETAPDFTISDGSRTVTLSQLRGKPVLLNFWASWCGPCVEEMPSLVQLQKQMGDKATVLAISLDSDDKAYQQFVRDHNVDLLTVRDPKQISNSLYGTFKFPETYVIDKNGNILRKFIGAVDWTNPEIVDYVNKL